LSDLSVSNPSFPNISTGNDTSPEPSGNEQEDEDEEEFLYPGVTEQPEHNTSTVPATVSKPPHPSPAQLEALYAAASSGELSLLQRLFRSALESGDVEAFALANDASTRTGFTALHAAASRGYIDIVKWCKTLFIRRRPSFSCSFNSGRGLWCHARLGR